VVAGVTLKPLRLGATKAAMVDAAETYDGVRGARLGLEPVVMGISGMFLQEKTGEQNDDLCESRKSRWKHVGKFL